MDVDDDDDGWNDNLDAFPKDQSEWMDSDGDGIGNNEDPDDDDDGWLDQKEGDCGTDPLDASSQPEDLDGDSLCDAIDTDDDGDKWSDSVDAFPREVARTTAPKVLTENSQYSISRLGMKMVFVGSQTHRSKPI